MIVRGEKRLWRNNGSAEKADILNFENDTLTKHPFRGAWRAGFIECISVHLLPFLRTDKPADNGCRSSKRRLSETGLTRSKRSR